MEKDENFVRRIKDRINKLEWSFAYSDNPTYKKEIQRTIRELKDLIGESYWIGDNGRER